MATHHDADLILRLYDLRRESVMRQARAWFSAWKPQDAEEAKRIQSDFSLQENAWLRQVTTYWEMAFSMANEGAVDVKLFAKNSGEGVLFATKLQWLAQQFPGVWTRSMPEAETFIGMSPIAQAKRDVFRKRFG